MTLIRTGLAAAALLGLGTVPAAAHHSFGMFDLAKVVTVTGTVKDYQFKMPHVWVYVVVADAAGKPQEWGFEAHSPNMVARKGWNIKTLKPGDKLTLLMHPMRDGSRAGSLINATLPDGRLLWNAESLTQP